MKMGFTSKQPKPLSNYSDPEYIGPGVWYLLHIKGAHAISQQEKEDYASTFRLFCREFMCKKCSGHCIEMLNNIPPENYFDIEDGCLRHSVDAHNTVNARLGKPTYDFNTIRNFILGDNISVCNFGCGDDNGIDDGDADLSTLAENNPALISRVEIKEIGLPRRR